MKVILNPYANRWRARGQQPEIEAALTAAGLDYDISVTGGPTEGIEMARTAVSQRYDVVVAAGGDGTISEVVNGLIQACPDAPTVPLGIMPVGSANDFAKMAAIPLLLPEAARAIAAGQTRPVDVGRIRLNDRVHYFNNNSAVAMEPLITLEHIKIKRVRGELRYLLALVRGIIKLKAWQMSLSWDGGSYEGPSYLLSLCNSAQTGGFTMAPGAVIDDGRFDFVFAPEVPKRTVVVVLLRLLQGTHVHHPMVTFGSTTHLTLTSRPGTPIHADGEILGAAETAVSYQIMPGKLTLLAPAATGK